MTNRRSLLKTVTAGLATLLGLKASAKDGFRPCVHDEIQIPVVSEGQRIIDSMAGYWESIGMHNQGPVNMISREELDAIYEELQRDHPYGIEARAEPGDPEAGAVGVALGAADSASLRGATPSATAVR